MIGNREKVIEGARAYYGDIINQIDRCPFPVLGWHVAPQYQAVGLPCDDCGTPFPKPHYSYAGVPVFVIYAPSGIRVVCEACIPQDIQWATHLFSVPANEEPETADIGMEQGGLWE